MLAFVTEGVGNRFGPLQVDLRPVATALDYHYCPCQNSCDHQRSPSGGYDALDVLTYRSAFCSTAQ